MIKFLFARWLVPILVLLPGLEGLSFSLAEPGGKLSAASPWPQVPPVASYDITVALDPTAHTLTGHEVITYYNRGADSLSYMVFHLYLNAFRNRDTLFMRESGASSRGFSYDPRHPGWTEVDALALESDAGQRIDLLPTTTVSETLMTTILPQPLLPGETLTLTLDFHALLPKVFARTGFTEDFHMAGQWFPKLAVYRPGKGWNAHPFHANSEFFADFGTYDVAITVPEGYVLGATGLPAGQEAGPAATVTHHFHAEAVIDFAWTAWPHFQEARRQVGAVEVVLLSDPARQHYAERYLDAAEQALKHYGDWYGPYPYPRLTIVQVPGSAAGAGGMEYPTLVTVGVSPLPGAFEGITPEWETIHEIAHQWWQSTVATNEFEEPWLDEGLAEYSGTRLAERVYGPQTPVLQLGPFKLGALDMDRMQYLLQPETAIYGRAWDFTFLEYAVAAYFKPALALTTLERILGEERWLATLRTYYQRYQFQHPTTEDLFDVVAEVAGENARGYLEPLVYGAGLVDYAATALACSREGTIQHCEVEVSRLGEAVLPVEVEVAFADGRRVREQWDGSAAARRYVYDHAVPVEWVRLDPDEKICLDVNYVNNSLTRQVQTEAMVQISSPWLYALEQMILILGGLW